MAGTKSSLDRPPWETVRLYQLCVASRKWDSINYLWDWALLLVFGRWPKCQVQPTALGQLGKLWLEISSWKIKVMKNLKQQNWSVDCDLSKTAIKRQSNKNSTVWDISSGCSDQPARLLLDSRTGFLVPMPSKSWSILYRISLKCRTILTILEWSYLEICCVFLSPDFSAVSAVTSPLRCHFFRWAA